MESLKNDSLGDRMKRYELVSTAYLSRRIPVIIRVDGRAFSNFCKRFEKPYSEFLNKTLNGVMKYLCQNIQGCKFATRHSDEISLLLMDYDTIKTEAFFDYKIPKICSVVASMATSEFCRLLAKQEYFVRGIGLIIDIDEEWPTFDARCFNVPESDVINYYYWRQLDSLRNSISMLAQSKFSHKELQGKNKSQMQEMLFEKFGINWNDIPQGQKTGFACLKNYQTENSIETSMKSRWDLLSAPSNRQELKDIIEKIFETNERNDMDINSSV